MNATPDVVCVGGGGAGLAAAVAAAEAGARVVVLEKRHVLGGNSRVATGVFGADSPAQERLNIVAPRDDLFRVAVEYAHWAVNAPLLRAFVDRSGVTIAWLESLGVDFEWIPPLFETQFPPTWHVPVGGGPTMVDAVVRRATELGVDIRVDTGVVGLARAGDGFTVTAEGDGGGVFQVPAVVIATGGFAGNAELLREHCAGYDPASWFCMGLRHQGDGIRLALALGVAPDGLGLCEFEAPGVQGPLFLSLVIRDPATLIVNRDGRRFFDESIVDNCFEAANALLRQPGQVAFGVIDAPLRDEILRKAANKARGPLYEDQMRDATQFERLLDGLAPPRGAVAGSLANAASAVGLDPAALEATVDEYNAACARGVDGRFGKHRRHLRPLAEPPFHVVRGTVGFLNTIGGLRVSERLEAVDADDLPVPGLYAAGVDVGGWQGDTYCFRLAGSSLGFALTSGLVAGEQAAAHAARRRTGAVAS